MKYGWIIDKDHFFNPEFDSKSAVGVMGHRGIDSIIESELKDGRGGKFRMLDDDGDVVYEGRIMGPDFSGFEPLDDYGTPNFGCTTIEYCDAAGKWYQL